MNAKNSTLAVVALLLLVAAATPFLPVPAGSNPFDFRFWIGLTLADMIAHIGASIIFLSVLKNYTPKLKRSYALLCLGFVLLGIGYVQFPLAFYGGQIEAYFSAGKDTGVLFLVALLAIYFGARKLAKTLEVRSTATQWWFVVVPAALLASSVYIMPHAPISGTEAAFDTENAFTTVSGWVDFVAMILILQAKRKANPRYAEGWGWLAIGFGVMLTAAIGNVSSVLLLGNQQWFLIGAIPFIPLTVAGFIFLRAAYSFKRITEPGVDKIDYTSITSRDFFGKPRQASTKTAAVTSAQIVAYTASLATNAQAIDPLLDKMRSLTATHPTGKPFSEKEEARLKETYLEVEEYLLKKETGRAFTRQSLRQTVANGLELTNDSTTFWRHLPQ